MARGVLRGRRQEGCRQGRQLQGRISRSFQGLRTMSLSETVLELRACRQKKENALGQTAGVVDEVGEEETDQEETEVRGVWLVGSFDEVRDGWGRRETTDAVRLMQTEIGTVNKFGSDQEDGRTKIDSERAD